MESKSSGLVSPAQVGNKGGKGSGPSPAGGKLVSPSKSSNASEASGHKNGK